MKDNKACSEGLILSIYVVVAQIFIIDFTDAHNCVVWDFYCGERWKNH